jgi:hypothetical protein
MACERWMSSTWDLYPREIVDPGTSRVDMPLIQK